MAKLLIESVRLEIKAQESLASLPMMFRPFAQPLQIVITDLFGLLHQMSEEIEELKGSKSND